MKKINPFKPNSPVPTAMFAGRLDEVRALESGLHQTKHGQASNYLITGERGIGKSSLMMYLKHASNGDIESLEYGNFNFLTIQIVISKTTDIITLIKLIEINIKREVGKTEVIRNFLSDTWAFVQRIKVMDSGVNKKSELTELDLLLDELSYSLSETCKRLTSENKGEKKFDGIVFFIDEADNACDDLMLGYFFKAVTELLQKNDCQNAMFVVAGLPHVVEKLSESHPSSLRLFSHLNVKELAPDDRKYVIEKGIEKANEMNEQKTTIAEGAIKNISTLSEGYPHFIQQFAYSAFELDSDNNISSDDVLEAALEKGGALYAIGQRYYASSFYDKIKSDEYREILTIMAENLNAWVKKSGIREEFSGNDAVLSNALSALTDRKIILKNTSKRGEYRLQQRGFALWIKLFGNRDK